MATDYKTSCGSDPLKFIQLWASTIVGYADLAGVTHYRLNGLEYTDACTEITGNLLDCDTSHISPERQLVENVFALDDCGTYLAMKAFNNSSEFTDYSECGEVPQTFIQMLARCIIEYDGAFKINTFVATAECTELTQLLDCDVNAIEAERLLVQNLFAVDDCGYLGIKVFSNQSTMTDYSVNCVEDIQSFYQMLARCLVVYNDVVYLNVAKVSGYCDSLTAFWTCSNNHIPPEDALVENVFATDDCDIMALKWLSNQGEEERQ